MDDKEFKRKLCEKMLETVNKIAFDNPTARECSDLLHLLQAMVYEQITSDAMTCVDGDLLKACSLLKSGGQPVEAIKLYRTKHRDQNGQEISLLEAKKFIDALR